VFGKKDNTNAIELSDIAAGIGGFVIIGESVGDYSGCSVSSAGDVNDLPAFDLLLKSGPQICGVPVDDLSLGVA
jgi:hypothetical protein